MGKATGIADLSRRELEVARAYAQGDNYRTAAARLFIAPSTLRTHIRTIYRKLGVSSKIELLRALESIGAVESVTGKPGSAIPPGRKTAVSDLRAWSAQPSAGFGDAGSSAKPELIKRSIAVLSFDNMSRDSETGHMGDGIAEDIITALSKIARMRVIARYSTFAYKGQAQDVREIARALSVRYVLEGSVRRSGSRIRVVARLIDTEDEARHIWAERYDRELADIFDIQDEITKEIVTALRVKLTDGESAAVWSRGTNSVAAWERAVRATDLFHRFNVIDYLEARRLAEEAVALDANYGYAHARVGWTWWWDARLGFTGRSEEKFARADRIADKAMALGEVANIMGLRTVAHAAMGRYSQALEVAEDYAARLPGDADGHGFVGYALMLASRYADSLEKFARAIELNPHPPIWYRSAIAKSLSSLGRDDEALEICNRLLAESRLFFQANLMVAAIKARQGRKAEAEEAIRQVRRAAPLLRARHLRRLFLLRDETIVANTEETFVRLGLPP